MLGSSQRGPLDRERQALDGGTPPPKPQDPWALAVSALITPKAAFRLKRVGEREQNMKSAEAGGSEG